LQNSSRRSVAVEWIAKVSEKLALSLLKVMWLNSGVTYAGTTNVAGQHNTCNSVWVRKHTALSASLHSGWCNSSFHITVPTIHMLCISDECTQTLARSNGLARVHNPHTRCTENFVSYTQHVTRVAVPNFPCMQPVPSRENVLLEEPYLYT
jgi:hypothetical protein